MASTIKPVPVAMILCDSIYTDASSGKRALVGLFNKITAPAFPYVLPRMVVFVSVTGLRKDSHAKLEIVNAEDAGKRIMEAKGPLPERGSPLDTVEISFAFQNMRFQEAGIYDINFWSNDHLLFARQLIVKQAEYKGKKRGEDHAK